MITLGRSRTDTGATFARSLTIAARCWLLAALCCLPCLAQTDAEHYARWLRQDVLYIISPEERDVFKKLTNDAERDAFIEQFWKRRDPNPLTRENEYQEEHYRRLQHAIERFSSGKPGWMTDRGRIYIKYGPPSSVESRPTGGTLVRDLSEGGGMTYAYPFEIWRYNRIEGIGENIEIEFVDPSRTNEYRIARSPQDKDSLLFVPGTGLTMAEELGAESRTDRITRDFLADRGRSAVAGLYSRSAAEQPFERLALRAALDKAPAIQFKDLQQMVSTSITYSQVPFLVRTEILKLAAGQALVPVTLAVDNSVLQYGIGEGAHRAQISLYARVQDLAGRIVAEFDQLLDSKYDASLPMPPSQRLLFQKVLLLKSGRYNLSTVVKDVLSGKVGTRQQLLEVPPLDSDQLHLSSLVLATHIEKVEEKEGRFEQFALGDVKVVPSMEGKFQRGGMLWVYYQAYNAGLEPSTSSPRLALQIQVLKDNRVVGSFKDEAGRSIRNFNDARVVISQGIPLKDFPPGKYVLRVQVRDTVTGQTTSADTPVEIL